MPSVNPGPSLVTTVNTQTPVALGYTVQTIAVTITPAQVNTITAPEQSYGLNGVSFVTAATGIRPGDTILAVNAPSVTAGVALCNFRVDPAVSDKFYVQWVNPTAGNLTPPAGVYLVTVQRPNQSNVNPLATTVATQGWPTSIQP